MFLSFFFSRFYIFQDRSFGIFPLPLFGTRDSAFYDVTLFKGLIEDCVDMSCCLKYWKTIISKDENRIIVRRPLAFRRIAQKITSRYGSYFLTMGTEVILSNTLGIAIVFTITLSHATRPG